MDDKIQKVYNEALKQILNSIANINYSKDYYEAFDRKDIADLDFLNKHLTFILNTVKYVSEDSNEA